MFFTVNIIQLKALKREFSEPISFCQISQQFVGYCINSCFSISFLSQRKPTPYYFNREDLIKNHFGKQQEVTYSKPCSTNKNSNFCCYVTNMDFVTMPYIMQVPYQKMPNIGHGQDSTITKDNFFRRISEIFKLATNKDILHSIAHDTYPVNHAIIKI